MKISILTVCPEPFGMLDRFVLIRRAVQRGLLDVEIVDMRTFAGGSFRHVDDAVYGPGAGMVIRYPVVHRALEAAGSGYRVLLSAGGRPYSQKDAHRFAGMDHLILVCGHYEGFDARIEGEVQEEISVGDYILSGGEIPAMMIMDSIVRLLGTIRGESTEDESFENGLLEYPQYTSPRSFNGLSVPEVLLSGDHEKIRLWRLKESLRRTAERRPDLLEHRIFSEEEQAVLSELLEQKESSTVKNRKRRIGMKPIKYEELERMNEAYLKDPKARVVRHAVMKNDIDQIARVFEAEADNPNFFSIDIKTMPVTNQMASGRCWIFSSLNVMREMIAKKYNIEKFELSQNYVAFYDKLEKINYCLEAYIAEGATDYNDPTLRWLLETAVGDGGQWDMLVSLIKKYGICPKTAMPETYQSSHTRTMNGIINKRLRRFAAQIKARRAAGEEDRIAADKEEALSELYGLLCDCFGVPPKQFTFEYYDKDRKYNAHRNVTPLEFYRDYLAEDLDDYVGIINGPTADKPFHKMYTVKYLGNVVGGNPVSFLNLPIDEFKDLILRQLQDGRLVWFGCDCGKDGDRGTGLWDDAQYAYEDTFDVRLDMTKAEMLDTRQSAMNHAMVFTGVNVVDGKPTRWKIENSWGDKVANEGYYICSDSWFEKYVFEAVVHKSYLSEELQAVLKEEPKVLDPWDPFGSLAD